MHSVKGRYDGHVVILNEPAPVDHAVEVVVNFPEERQSEEQQAGASEETKQVASRFSWERTRRIKDGYAGSVTDELIRQRRMD